MDYTFSKYTINQYTQYNYLINKDGKIVNFSVFITNFIFCVFI